MKILVCTGMSEPEYCTGKSLIRAFRRAGHEICVAGPVYGRFHGETLIKENGDIELVDKPYPEAYSYEEVLSKAPWRPDFALQIEPHCYLVGDKPEWLKSYYWVLDPHRGGIGHRNMARSGHFDGVFITQKFFADSYIHVGMKAYWMPQAVDTERVKHYPGIIPECDMAYIGETGIKNIVFDKADDDGWEYCNSFPDKMEFSSPYEYHERAMLIANLTRVCDLRIYKKRHGEDYAKIIQKGRFGFHRSLNKDLALRVFEIMACKRAIIMDEVPDVEEVFHHTHHAFIYKQYGYHPELPNFALDLEMAKMCVNRLMEDKNVRDAMAGIGYRYVLESHTYDARAKSILELVSNDMGK